MAFIRLYLVPLNGQQQILDVPDNVLVMSSGKFVPPQMAPTVTLRSLPVTHDFTAFDYAQDVQAITVAGTQEVRVCFREPEGVQEYPDTDVVEATDPSGGNCICGVSCAGTELQYVKVHNVNLPL